MSSTALPSVDSRPFQHVVIVGVGLIGGSIAKALKSRGLVGQVTGLGRDRLRLTAAQQSGVIDRIATSISEVGDFSQAVVCTPVDRIVQDVESLRATARSDAWITDAGSVKGAICRAIQTPPDRPAVFIGSHPMAGSELGGWEHASESLFEGRVCAITPLGQPEKLISSVEHFWASLGMKTIRLAPDHHDRIVGLTSHLPHVAAAAVASLLTEEGWALAATGFHDTTRIAGGDPQLWTSILMGNREALAPQLRHLASVIDDFILALDANCPNKIEELLRRGQSARSAWQNGIKE